MAVLEATRENYNGLSPNDKSILNSYAVSSFGGDVDAMLANARLAKWSLNQLGHTALTRLQQSQYQAEGVPEWSIDGVYDGPIGNPKYPTVARPKIKGGSPWQTQTPDQGKMWGSVANQKGQFYAPFTNSTGFGIYKKSHPKTKLQYADEDIDGDNTPEAVVRDENGNLITVNGMGLKPANFGTLQPYYQNRSETRYNFEIREGFRDADGKVVVAGIAKAFREHFLKDIYNAVLNPKKQGLSDNQVDLIMRLRKEAPMGACSKEFVRTFMRTQAQRAVVAHNVPVADQPDAVKRLLSTKKFKQHMAQLLSSIPLTMENVDSIKQMIRVTIRNATRGTVDIAGSPTWGDIPPNLRQALQG
jgi:hypothetical protein